MSQFTKPRSLTTDEARRLGDKYWLVEVGIWSVTTARQWLSRLTCLQHIQKQGCQLEKPKRRGRRCDHNDVAWQLCQSASHFAQT